MTSQRIVIIGAGISGLSAAWLLQRTHQVILLEKETRLGGHTHTHERDDPSAPGGRLALDTGFLVHNDCTYPLLIRLFNELGVERLDSDMSFGVTSRRPDFEYSTRNLNGLFAQRRNLWRPAHYRFVAEILRFNRIATQSLSQPAQFTTLGDFLDAHNFRGEFLDRFLFPMASAVWSAATSTLRAFPAETLIRFFYNHGILSVTDHPTWKVVRGGSARYIDRMRETSTFEVRTGCAPVRIVRMPDGVRVDLGSGEVLLADHVVFACHGDEVLPLLADATPAEQRVLSAFRTSVNETWLHTDRTFLPRRQAAGASWNALLGERDDACLTYDLNRLQRLQSTTQYCVTLNPPRPIDDRHVIAHMTYRHPLYTHAAIEAQQRWHEISGVHRAHFCGAYWFYGFHEDGLRSAVRVAAHLGVTW